MVHHRLETGPQAGLTLRLSSGHKFKSTGKNRNTYRSGTRPRWTTIYSSLSRSCITSIVRRRDLVCKAWEWTLLWWTTITKPSKPQLPTIPQISPPLCLSKTRVTGDSQEPHKKCWTKKSTVWVILDPPSLEACRHLTGATGAWLTQKKAGQTQLRLSSRCSNRLASLAQLGKARDYNRTTKWEEGSAR